MDQNVLYLKGSIEKTLAICDYEILNGEVVEINKGKISPPSRAVCC